jgi:hypothetical protein
LLSVGTGQLILILLNHRWVTSAVGWDWDAGHIVTCRAYLANAKRLGLSTPSILRVNDVRNLTCYTSQLVMCYWTGTPQSLRHTCLFILLDLTYLLFVPRLVTSPPIEHNRTYTHCLVCHRHATLLSVPNGDTRRDVRVCDCCRSDLPDEMVRNACKLYHGSSC